MELNEILFGNNIAIRTLVYLRHNKNNNYATKIMRDIDCTRCSMTKKIEKLVDMGLLEVIIFGRKKIICLTKKGENIVDNILHINSSI